MEKDIVSRIHEGTFNALAETGKSGGLFKYPSLYALGLYVGSGVFYAYPSVRGAMGKRGELEKKIEEHKQGKKERNDGTMLEFGVTFCGLFTGVVGSIVALASPLALQADERPGWWAPWALLAATNVWSGIREYRKYKSVVQGYEELQTKENT